MVEEPVFQARGLKLSLIDIILPEFNIKNKKNSCAKSLVTAHFLYTFTTNKMICNS
jgi:hypothetical protein